MRGPFNFRRQNSRDWLVARVNKIEGPPVPAPLAGPLAGAG